jgi:hypothetical protein
MPDTPPRAKKPQLTPQQRAQRARMAAHASWARTRDRAARTSAGTQAFLRTFERQVDPDQSLPADVRRKMAAHARKSYMLRLAKLSADARRRARTAPRKP